MGRAKDLLARAKAKVQEARAKNGKRIARKVASGVKRGVKKGAELGIKGAKMSLKAMKKLSNTALLSALPKRVYTLSGKRYRAKSVHFTKGSANDKADDWREKNYNVRVLKRKLKGHRVYVVAVRKAK